MKYELNLREVTSALSTSLDYVGVDDNLHGKRVAYLSFLIGIELGFAENELSDIIFEGILHDCGVSSTSIHEYLVSEMDWEHSQDHCLRGEELLNQVSFYKQYASVIRYHHTHIDRFPESIDAYIKLHSNIIYLTDRVDALRAQGKNLDEILKILKSDKGDFFDTQLVSKFETILSKYEIEEKLQESELEIFLDEWIVKGERKEFSYVEVQEIALMFGYIVDAKSDFTIQHSIGVAHLSKFLAEVMNLDGDSCEKVEIAGFLHDLGKLKVHDKILNKPAPLNSIEREIMNNHSKDSSTILSKIRGFEEIALLSELHHETLDGKGYPNSRSAIEIPLLARVIAVADIFQALVQNRPYRQGLSKEKALNIIEDMCKEGKLDSIVVKTLRKNLDVAYIKALQQRKLKI